MPRARFIRPPFSEAAVMVADHSGGRFVDETTGECVAETLSFYHAGGTDIELLACTHGGDEEPKFIERATYLRGSRGIDIVKRPKNSLGRLYARVANACRCQSRMGDGKLHTESGKLMGLAAYGDDRFLSELERFVEIAQDGTLRVEMGGPNDGLEGFCKVVLSRGIETRVEGSSDREAAFIETRAQSKDIALAFLSVTHEDDLPQA
jgi:predicted NodU family carbamoyl transferase